MIGIGISIPMMMAFAEDASAFVRPGVLRSPFVISRAQTTGVESSAINGANAGLTLYGADVPRFNGPAQRLLIEGQCTNLIDGMAAPVTQNVTVTAAAHTLTFYGTGSITLSGVATGTLNGTGAFNRVTLTFTPTAGTLTLTVSGTVTQAQLELGSFASFYVQVASGAATRGTDFVTATLASLGIGSNGVCTVLWSGVVPNIQPDSQMQIWQIDDGGNTNRSYFRVVQNTANLQIAVVSGGIGAAGSFTPGTPFKVGCTYNATGRMASSLNGAAAVAITGGTLSGATTFRLGRQPGGAADAFMETGYLRILPYSVSDAELQSLTGALP
jgi:hypothetical protein